MKYDFTIQPNGEIPIGAYIEIELPTEIEIVDEDDFEASCGEDLYVFTQDYINCQVRNNMRTIRIINGFQFFPTTNLTDDDSSYDPPELLFTLDGFFNPREGVTTSPWNVTIYDSGDDVLYYWTETDSPTCYFSGISQPGYIDVIQENYANGAQSWLEFTVITTGGLNDEDKVVVKLPFGW